MIPTPKTEQTPLIDRLRMEQAELNKDKCWALHSDYPEGKLWGEAADRIADLERDLSAAQATVSRVEGERDEALEHEADISMRQQAKAWVAVWNAIPDAAKHRYSVINAMNAALHFIRDAESSASRVAALEAALQYASTTDHVFKTCLCWKCEAARSLTKQPEQQGGNLTDSLSGQNTDTTSLIAELDALYVAAGQADWSMTKPEGMLLSIAIVHAWPRIRESLQTASNSNGREAAISECIRVVNELSGRAASHKVSWLIVECVERLRELLKSSVDGREEVIEALTRVGEAAKGWLARYEDEVRDPSEEAPCKELVAATDALIALAGKGGV